MLKRRLYWIRWKLMDYVLLGYIKLHRRVRLLERMWVERKGAKTTWNDVFKALDKSQTHDQAYFNRLERWSKLSDLYWKEYIDLKYRVRL